MAADASRHVMIFGLEVKDEVLYRRYRAGMTPILQRYGGGFGYDFMVSEVLRSETSAPINRVFTIVFTEKKAGTDFFADPAYLAVRAELFEPAVGRVTKIGEYDEVA